MEDRPKSSVPWKNQQDRNDYYSSYRKDRSLEYEILQNFCYQQ